MKTFKFFKKTIVRLSVVLIVLIIGISLYIRLTPTVDISSANGITLLDNKKQIFFQGNSTNKWVNLSDINDNLIEATISSEDKNFYSHHGFDYARIGKAMMTNIRTGSKQGASTISQQYVKNLYLDFSQTWKRKWDELWLTLEIETHYTKDDILEGYLNTINYGHAMYGIENASEYYFGKKAKKLTLAEASLLAGIPKAPTYYSPFNNLKAAKKRQKYILKTMVENGYISEEEKNKALKENLDFSKGNKTELTTSVMYYKDTVLDELKDLNEIPSSLLATGGLKVYTSYDENAQKILEKNTKNDIDDSSSIQSSSIMINPNTGGIIALVGGRDYNASSFNRAIQSKRQVGSTMKSFLYYAALENGFTASSSFISEPTTFSFDRNSTYSPKNYNNKYANKAISMATAIAYSDNIFAVKTHEFLGEDILIEIVKRVGINSKMKKVPSLALGTSEMSLKELASGYSSFANSGYKVTPHTIERVEDKEGNVLYERDENKELILNPSLTFILSELLTGTYDSAFTDYNYPTALNLASRMSHKYALKSGTTDTDNIYIGYTPNVVTAVWCGYDDNSEVKSSEYKYAQNIWIDTMEQYSQDKTDSWYDIPSDVVGVMVQPITGRPADEKTKNKKIFYYLKGTEPSNEDMVFDEIEPNRSQ